MRCAGFSLPSGFYCVPWHPKCRGWTKRSWPVCHFCKLIYDAKCQNWFPNRPDCMEHLLTYRFPEPSPRASDSIYGTGSGSLHLQQMFHIMSMIWPIKETLVWSRGWQTYGKGPSVHILGTEGHITLCHSYSNRLLLSRKQSQTTHT